jgi:hypothetical protein
VIRREIHMEYRKNFYMQILVAREELIVGKRTNHVVLEGIHGLVVFYGEKDSCVSVKWVVIL